MNIASKIIGVIALLIALAGLLPLFGWLNWIAAPIAFIGLLVGLFGKNKGGMIFNGIVLLVSVIRLVMGGGVL